MQDRILDALRRGAHDDALTLAREAVAADPRDPGNQRLLAQALHASGDDQAALAAIDAAIALVPDAADLHFQRAGLLLQQRDLDAASAALSQSTTLDPNQFGAYVMQAQLAIGRNDLDEAERLQKLASRVAPEHPWTTMLAGTLASRRGEHDRALALLAQAAKVAPDDLQVLYANAFAYLAKGHLAFAEQAFRRVIEKSGNGPLRGVLAQIVLQQGRPADAADVIAELLADPAQATPGWQTLGGELELQAGRPERALPLLRAAFAAAPQSRRTTDALVRLWAATGAADEALEVLEPALAQHPAQDHLWLARLAFEPFASDAARDVIVRWQAAVPGHVPALQARLALEANAGDPDAALAAARAIAAVQPGDLAANDFIFGRLLERDPGAAVAFAQDLVPAAGDEGKLLLRRWIGIAQDAAGRPGDAAATWQALSVDISRQAGPPPAPTAAPAAWPAPGAADAAQPPAVFLYGPPGARVDRVVSVLQQVVPQFRGDRIVRGVGDAFQDTTVPAQLAAGRFTAAQVVGSWRQQLPARGIGNGAVIDWLPFWDNAWLLALRPELPQARLLLVVRDPRDMLLDWLAYGTVLTMRIDDAASSAAWLAAHLEQLADLHEQDLIPHTLLRNDDPAGDPAALAATLGAALGIADFPVPPAQALGPARLPAGHWRAYADVWPQAFAALTPVAVRLGYPQD
ncbi:tetratricopeptide repeat protein [Luteimonas sp. BDR2-5]|uniref:tetratricopeptide repeat protein n=1 Tax=Proluteimonas luteida TaxID=2878685 RepID=UPI001E40C367|nr:tetratricopeptide repeat protein [Luteimonas sp. BDR2-5]MCD9028036.1 tetratricopeptide repeat protein [Luteimonas sp. BDR2-5]